MNWTHLSSQLWGTMGMDYIVDAIKIVEYSFKGMKFL